MTPQLLAALLDLAHAAPDDPAALIDAALAANQPHRNTMYLFLRVAGVAWIAIEWVAAFALWRAWRTLRTRAGATP